MGEHEEKGRRVIVGTIAWIGLSEAATLLGGGAPYFGAGTFIRIFLTAILCFYLYLRAPQARWGTVIWMGFGSLVAFSSGLPALWPAGAMDGLITLMMFSNRVEAYFSE